MVYVSKIGGVQPENNRRLRQILNLGLVFWVATPPRWNWKLFKFSYPDDEPYFIFPET